MDDSTEVVRFNKRRKIHRRREDREERDATTVSAHDAKPLGRETIETSHESKDDSDAGLPTETSVAELLRQRKLAKARRGGIEFSNLASKSQAEGGNHQALDVIPAADETANAVEMAHARFAPQTGTVTESHDRHMMAYIDSEMARMRAGNAAAANSKNGNSSQTDESGGPLNLSARQPAALGQIQEIDLGPDAAQRNIAMTEAATRRLQNGQPLEAEEQKVRLGRDGKPRRPRRRRASDDLKRDEVVEAILRENKLDIYDESGTYESGNAAENEDADAVDDIVAERFKREFLEATQMRNRMRKPPANAANKKKNPLEEKARGPKLGGSRSARAAMHAAEKAKTAKK